MLRNCVRSRAEQLEEKRAIKKKFREMAERGADRERNSPLIRSTVFDQYRWIFANFREPPLFSKNRSRELISNLLKSWGRFAKKEWTIIRSRFGEEERQHHPWRARRINENLVRTLVRVPMLEARNSGGRNYIAILDWWLSLFWKVLDLGEEEFQECGKIVIVRFPFYLFGSHFAVR